ncbi:chloride channel protein ClC-Kb-like isoform X2 [Oryzias latipes]|uniref:chloride channel protein ClC-Kb-like isoform X2 n=1 Tax=Oryzias latipes TaxID=8090 RepID=UPI000CE17A3B|nr:chloride channel protein ClC-Kb-like isoform X2 [Oryzias latipes]
MKQLEELPERKRDQHENVQESEKQPLSSVKSSVFLVQWKPCRETHSTVKDFLLKLQRCLGAVCGMQWYAYATLGITMALLSFLMDFSVAKMLGAQQWLYGQLEGNFLLQFLCWTLYPACLCALAATFCQSICPFSTGSGIPEVRTMLAGIDMPLYLSLTNMFSKFLGLFCTLAAGSTVFLGKVGPFVHLSTMFAAYLDNMFSLLQGIKKEKTSDMLVVAAAVGVASCFGAPVSETVQALFKTNFPSALPFYPLEIVLFAFLGLLCGAVGCCYLFCHRWILQFTKTNPLFIRMQTEKGLYSAGVVFFLACLTFPPSTGQYMASEYTTKELLTSLLDCRQWSSLSHNASVHQELSLKWNTSEMPLLLSLAFFLLMKIWMLVLACTLPLPAGYFMPMFVLGAAGGRLLGEGVAHVFSTGVVFGHHWDSVYPGVYALAGAAALSGAVTHTLSPALLAVELTGQFSHAVPILLATLLANGLARSGNRPSFYDAISINKKLPHLPSLVKAYPQISLTTVAHILEKDSVQLQKAAGPEEVRHIVVASVQLQIPVVDSEDSQILVGFVQRSELLKFLHHCKTQNLQQQMDDVCCIQPVSSLLSPSSTVDMAYSMMSVLELQTLFVADKGKLVGCLTWSKMKEILQALAKEN